MKASFGPGTGPGRISPFGRNDNFLEAQSKTSALPRSHQDTKRIFEFSSLSRTFVTLCLGGGTFRPALVRSLPLVEMTVIISVGYPVKSKRGTQFRIWATSVLPATLSRFPSQSLNE